ncbi:MAG: hypothetical protein D6798_11115 [Deltaproteobacteria bacterium]|nr:MAG: hypothetical protein D6798_11115 [Deltaproteobacteria bacterium]
MDPATAQQAQTIAVSVFVVLLMLSVGLDLSLPALARVVRRPGGLVAGIAGQYVVVPPVALAIAHGLGLPPAPTAGLVLCAVAPGGPMGAYLALQARGDVALAAALVLVCNLLNTVFVPFGLDLAGVHTGPTDGDYLWPMARMILLFQVLPLSAGVVVRRLAPDRALRLQRGCARLANLILVVVAVVVVSTQLPRFLDAGMQTLLAVEGTVLTAMATGWLLAPRRRPARIALACTGVIHSVSACVLLASAWFPDPATLLTVFAYSGMMFTTGVVAARWMRRTES